MDKRLEQARKLLKERERRAVLRHLNNLSDKKAIEQLKKAISFYKDAPDLDPCDLQKLIDEFQVFSVQVKNNQNEIEEKLLNTLEEVFEYNRTGINPYSKKQMAQRLEVEEQKLVYEDNSLLSLLIDLNSKCSSLDDFIGGLKDWPHSCSKRDWQKRIEKLLFLKELYPVRMNISGILTGKYIQVESGYNQYREWLEDTFKVLKEGLYPDDEALQSESIRQEVKDVGGNGLSDNRVAKRLRILFNHKFPSDISISQIKGMVIYKRR